METTIAVQEDTKAVYRAAFKALRAELAASVAQAKAARAAIHEKKKEPPSEERGRELQALWADKRCDRDTRRELALALAYLKGRAYASCERKAVIAPYTGGIAKLLTRVGIPTTAGEVGAWVTPAKAQEEAAA
jgi:hypothetical protein